MYCFGIVLLCFLGPFPSISLRRGDLTERFFLYEFGGLIIYLEGLIHGGAYFWNFTVVYDNEVVLDQTN